MVRSSVITNIKYTRSDSNSKLNTDIVFITLLFCLSENKYYLFWYNPFEVLAPAGELYMSQKQSHRSLYLL